MRFFQLTFLLMIVLGFAGCQEEVYQASNCVPPEVFGFCQDRDQLCDEVNSDILCNESSADYILDYWTKTTRQCFLNGDLECVKSKFRFLAWGGTYFFRVAWFASTALRKFLDQEDCDTPLEVPKEVLLKNSHISAFELTSNIKYRGVASLEEVKRFANARFQSDVLEFSGQMIPGQIYDFEIDTYLTSPGNTNAQQAVGRIDLHVRATNVVLSNRRIRYQLEFEFFDRYDWNPSGFEPSTEHDWANALVDADMACEFDMHGKWSEEMQVYL